MADIRALTMAGSDDDSLINYLSQVASYKGIAFFRLPQSKEVVMMNSDSEGDLCDVNKDKKPWFLIQLMVFEWDNSEYPVWSCRTCECMKTITSLGRVQDHKRLVNNICSHSKVITIIVTIYSISCRINTIHIFL